MSYCPECSSALDLEPAKPGTIPRGTAEGQFFRLWCRSYRQFRQSAPYCRICKDIFSYQFDPSNYESMRGLLELSEIDRDKLSVTGELFWTGKVFDRLIVRFVELVDNEDGIEEDSGIAYGYLGYDIITLDDISTLSSAVLTHGSQWNLPLMRRWLEDCSKHHKSCTARNGNDWWPTRLLDVSSESGLQDVRLVSSKHKDQDYSYTTLSHRWSEGKMPTLTTDNIDEFQQKGLEAFQLDSIPQTFVDAFEITRQLGIKYIWIDCLCILQDSVEDWELESAIMGKVYELGQCNLAASGASSGGKGLCKQLQEGKIPIDIAQCEFECNWNAHEPHRSRKNYLLQEGTWEFGVQDAELNKRGWIVQEMCLSPRTIHFGLERLFWECRQKRSFSIVKNGRNSELVIPQHRWSGIGRKNWRKFTEEAKSEYLLGTTNLNNIYKAWHLLRGIYVGTLVTYERDKLVALSGIARSFQQLLGDQYLAGLWRKTLVYDLLWSVPKPRKRTAYRAPSWSWASMEDGKLWWEGHTRTYPYESHELVRVVDAKVASSTSDATGQVSSGCISLLGSVFLLGNGDGDGPFKLPVEWPDTLAGLVDLRIEDFEVKFDEDQKDADREKYLCLHLLLEHHYLSSGNSLLHGLVLKPVAEPGNDFRRAGFFRCGIRELDDYYTFMDCACSIQDEGAANIYKLVTIV